MATIPLTFTAACDRRLVAVEVSSQRTVEWAVEVPHGAPAARRAPLSLALVIDRSGSMQGEKLRFAKQAAHHVLDMLDERDRVAVVAYDDHVTLLSSSVPVTAQAREDLKRRVDELRPGGWTDLSGGWLEGCRAIAEHQLGDAIGRALLMTDGMANRGITDLEELAHHARELRKRGVATSTFGVGLDFNEHLLEALGEQGGGHFYYIDRPEQIPGMFGRELGELLAVTAREAFLTIAIPKGVAVELLGDLAHERLPGRLRVFLGDLFSGERRSLYTRVLTPPDMAGTSVVLRGELSYADIDGHTTTVVEQIAFSYTREAEVLLAPLHEDILRRAGEVEMAAAAAQALKLERAGHRGQAQAVMSQALAASAPYMAAPAAAQYQALAGQMEHGLDEVQRKASHFAAYQARQSRG